jgi:hypothetical protein
LTAKILKAKWFLRAAATDMATATWDGVAEATIMAGAEATIAVGTNKPDHLLGICLAFSSWHFPGGGQIGGLLSYGASIQNPLRLGKSMEPQ